MMGHLSYRVDNMLRCPNCGGVAAVTEEHFNDGDIWYRPECMHCNVGWQENYPTIEEAVKAWNGSRIMETRPVVHARWVKDEYTHQYRCSNCNRVQPYDAFDCGDHDNPIYDYWDCDFCPGCGATMDLKEVTDE